MLTLCTYAIFHIALTSSTLHTLQHMVFTSAHHVPFSAHLIQHNTTFPHSNYFSTLCPKQHALQHVFTLAHHAPFSTHFNTTLSFHTAITSALYVPNSNALQHTSAPCCSTQSIIYSTPHSAHFSTCLK